MLSAFKPASGYRAVLVAWAFASLPGSISLSATAGDTRSFSSGESRVSLVELYTSEGCSSCPPADRWMSGLARDNGLWRTHVPLAFHVDYWDYIGWKDPFASPRYTDRQHAHAGRLGMRTVYTPGVFLDGQELRRWRGFSGYRGRDDMPGKLELTLKDGAIDARFRANASAGLPDHLDLTVAILGFDLQTDVQRGENAGRRLEHDFVVLGMHRVHFENENDTYAAMLELPQPGVSAPRLGLAAWVSPRGDTEPLQATGGWLSDASN